MTRVFITGSADGLGRAAAQTLIEDGHEVVVHARNTERLAAVRDLFDRGAKAVVGDLSDLEQTRDVANQVNRLGPMDAVIQNAGVISGPHVLPVNVVAPYVLTDDRPAAARDLPLKQHAQRGSSPASRDGLERAAQNRLVFGQQAVRHDPRDRRRAHLAGRAEQCGRSPGGCRRRWAAQVRRTICRSGT